MSTSTCYPCCPLPSEARSPRKPSGAPVRLRLSQMPRHGVVTVVRYIMVSQAYIRPTQPLWTASRMHTTLLSSGGHRKPLLFLDIRGTVFETWSLPATWGRSLSRLLLTSTALTCHSECFFNNSIRRGAGSSNPRPTTIAVPALFKKTLKKTVSPWIWVNMC